MAVGAVLSSSPGGGCHEAVAGEEECGQSHLGAWAREGELGLGLGDPRDPGREKLGSHILLASRPLNFILNCAMVLSFCPLYFNHFFFSQFGSLLFLLELSSQTSAQQQVLISVFLHKY